MSKWIIALLLASLMGLGVIQAYIVLVDSVHHALTDARSESQCIAKYISRGVERKDIKVGGGECWVNR